MGGSSSVRKQQRQQASRRRGTVFCPTTPAASQVSLDFADHAITSGVGFNLLCSMGHIPGHPLGSSSATPAPKPATEPTPPSSSDPRRTVPIPITLRRGRAGLGAPVALGCAEHARGSVAQSVPADASRAFMSPARSAAAASASSQASAVSALASSIDALSFTRDPLRPRCRHNREHVVASLKALQLHESKCPDAPTAPVFLRNDDEEAAVNDEGEGDGEEDGIMSEMSTDSDCDFC
jgi:G-patch domain